LSVEWDGGVGIISRLWELWYVEMKSGSCNWNWNYDGYKAPTSPPAEKIWAVTREGDAGGEPKVEWNWPLGTESCQIAHEIPSTSISRMRCPLAGVGRGAAVPHSFFLLPMADIPNPGRPLSTKGNEVCVYPEICISADAEPILFPRDSCFNLSISILLDDGKRYQSHTKNFPSFRYNEFTNSSRTAPFPIPEPSRRRLSILTTPSQSQPNLNQTQLNC
jgi:hypothetical protein